mgnify:CR=1 FL=1
MKKICILGSTGSIGRQSIEVCKALRFPVVGLAAHSNTELLAQQIHALRPKAACIFDQSRYAAANWDGRTLPTCLYDGMRYGA